MPLTFAQSKARLAALGYSLKRETVTVGLGKGYPLHTYPIDSAGSWGHFNTLDEVERHILRVEENRASWDEFKENHTFDEDSVTWIPKQTQNSL